jgi:hypothetical protein
MSFLLGGLILAVLFSAFGSFAFRYQLMLFYRTVSLSLPSWAIPYSWALKGLAIMAIGLFSAFGKSTCEQSVRATNAIDRYLVFPYGETSCGASAW